MESHTLQRIIEQMPFALAIFDSEMRYRAVSNRHLSNFAWMFSTEFLPLDKVIGRRFREVFPDMPVRWREVHDRVLAGEELEQEEDFVPRKDGRAEWVRWHMRPWRDVHGQIGGALLVTELVTEQVENKRALFESEARFRVTFENAPVGIAHLSPDLRWLRANKTFCRIHGYPIDELMTKSLRDIVPPDDFAELVARGNQMRDGKIDRFETDNRILRKDGTISWVRVTGGCLRKNDGSIDYFVVVVEDISARKRAEEKLVVSEARFRATFENAAVGISHVAPDGKFLRFNKVLPQQLGWTADELLTKSLWEVAHPDDLALERDQFKKLADGKIDSYSVERRDLRKDGTPVWIRLTRSCVRKSDGSADYFVGVFEDISGRKRAEEELAASEARFRATFENAAVGITHVAPDGRFLRFNTALARLLGWPADELLTKSVWEITHPEDRALELAQFKQLEEGIIDSYSVEKRDLRKDGTAVWVRLTRSCVRKSDGSADYFVAVIEDISDHKRAEELLQRQADLLDHSHEAIFTWRIGGGITYWSRGAEDLYGYSRDEAIGRVSNELLRTRSDPSGQDREIRTLREGSWHGELLHTTSDGREIVVDSRQIRVSYDSEAYTLETDRDITERKHVEEELRKSEERFRSSVLHSPVPTILFDDQEQILAVSQSWLTTSGISEGELHNMEDWTIRAYGERSGEALDVIRGIIATEPQGQTNEETILTRSGEKRIWNIAASSLGTQSDGRRLFVAVAEDVTDRRAYEDRIHLLMREARHRTKNVLSLVQAIARQIATDDAQDFIGRFTERIQALAANQDLLVRHKWQRIDVKDLVQVQVGHFADLIGSRITFDGPKLHLNAAAAQTIGLALHELATNAGKYGALSTDAGCVNVNWKVDGGTFLMNWIERNGPPVRPPKRRGFGSTVTESMVTQSLHGDVQLDYAPSGLEWHLTCAAVDALEGTAKPAPK